MPVLAGRLVISSLNVSISFWEGMHPDGSQSAEVKPIDKKPRRPSTSLVKFNILWEALSNGKIFGTSK